MDIRIRINDNCAIEGFNYFIDMNNEDHYGSSYGVGCVTREECTDEIKAYLLQEAKY